MKDVRASTWRSRACNARSRYLGTSSIGKSTELPGSMSLADGLKVGLELELEFATVAAGEDGREAGGDSGRMQPVLSIVINGKNEARAQEWQQSYILSFPKKVRNFSHGCYVNHVAAWLHDDIPVDGLAVP